MRIESLTRENYTNLCGSPPSVTVKGLAVVDDEKTYGVVGVAVFCGKNFVICCTSKEISNRSIIKAWAIFSDRFLMSGNDYYAIMDDEIITAPSFLRHFGFERLKDDIYILRK